MVIVSIERNDDRRPHQDRVRDADRIRTRRRQRILHQTHHVVAEVTEHAGRHRRQGFRQRDAAFGDQRPQRRQRGGVRRRESVGIALRPAIDFRAPAVDAEHNVRRQPDDRIASAHFAAFDRFQQEAHC
jgi:hypothetical protein